MRDSLRAFLQGIVDYAGLFPPARLPLDQAIRNYARYRQGPCAWMLGRFICPAARLAELAPFHEELVQPGPPLAISALGRGGTNSQEFLTGLRADLDAVAAFRRHHGEPTSVDVYEVRLPPDVLPPAPADAAVKLLTYAADLVDEKGPPSLTPYYEIPLGTDWRSAVALGASALAQSKHFNLSAVEVRCRPGGFKLRCGGLEPAAFPTVEQVAAALTVCRAAAVPLKFTAGLHHPVRHFDAGLNVKAHGFLNLFAAGVLARARRLDERLIAEIVADEDAADFAFDDTGLRWKSLRASVAEIEDARQNGVLAFGSCSFDEPLDDLRSLGLLA